MVILKPSQMNFRISLVSLYSGIRTYVNTLGAGVGVVINRW